MNELGAMIRMMRARHGFTLAELANRSGVCVSMISEIERGNKTPTITTLSNIAEGLDSSVSELLGEERRQGLSIVTSAERMTLLEENTGIRRQLLSPAFQKRGLEILEYSIPAGAETGGFLPQLRGSAHHITVLIGMLAVRVGDVWHELTSGDSVVYGANHEHQYRNSGNDEVRFLLIMDRNTR